MSTPKQKKAIVKKQRCLCGQIFELVLKEASIANLAKAGQFVSVYCKEGGRLLPRPISLCGIDKEQGELTLVYRIAGEGTKEFSALKEGDEVVITGPLGNGFLLSDAAEETHSVLFGGGIGIPPMLQLARELPGKKTFYLGYRDRDTFLADEFSRLGTVVIATDDGSVGVHGNVVQAFRENPAEADVFFACGPKPMLRGVKGLSEETGKKAQISLEERMACGIGACLGCVCKTTKKEEHSKVNNARVCKEGPVFYADQVDLS